MKITSSLLSTTVRPFSRSIKITKIFSRLQRDHFLHDFHLQELLPITRTSRNFWKTRGTSSNRKPTLKSSLNLSNICTVSIRRTASESSLSRSFSNWLVIKSLKIDIATNQHFDETGRGIFAMFQECSFQRRMRCHSPWKSAVSWH